MGALLRLRGRFVHFGGSLPGAKACRTGPGIGGDEAGAAIHPGTRRHYQSASIYKDTSGPVWGVRLARYARAAGVLYVRAFLVSREHLRYGELGEVQHSTVYHRSG